jgi:hypothetical protein
VPFHANAVRDLLGILRCLYAEEQGRMRSSKKRLAVMSEIANDLNRALRMAAPHDPGTAPHERAAAIANRAVERLPEIFPSPLEDMPNIVRIAGLRVRGEWRRPRPNEREIKWAVGKQRG